MMLGGDLIAGPAERGFVVRVRLPVQDADRGQAVVPHHGDLPDADLQLVDERVP